MKVVIAGSRDITSPSSVAQAIRESGFDISEVVSGGARGVDKLGEQWAGFNLIPITRFIANWNSEGKAAGIIRNHKMALYADALIAIWDGKSKGTKHMILDMQKTGKPVYVYIVGEQHTNKSS